MVEGRVDDGVRLARAVAQAFEILERAAMDFGAHGGERFAPASERARPST